MNGDYQFGHNAGDFWYNQAEGVGQLVSTRLLLYRGEWFLDLQEGTPWGGFPLNQDVINRGQILGTHTELMRDVAVNMRVQETVGVQSIDFYDSQTEPNDRRFSVQMVITTAYGRLAAQITPITQRPFFILNWSAIGGSDPL